MITVLIYCADHSKNAEKLESINEVIHDMHFFMEPNDSFFFCLTAGVFYSTE